RGPDLGLVPRRRRSLDQGVLPGLRGHRRRLRRRHRQPEDPLGPGRSRRHRARARAAGSLSLAIASALCALHQHLRLDVLDAGQTFERLDALERRSDVTATGLDPSGVGRIARNLDDLVTAALEILPAICGGGAFLEAYEHATGWHGESPSRKRVHRSDLLLVTFRCPGTA